MVRMSRLMKVSWHVVAGVACPPFRNGLTGILSATAFGHRRFRRIRVKQPRRFEHFADQSKNGAKLAMRMRHFARTRHPSSASLERADTECDGLPQPGTTTNASEAVVWCASNQAFDSTVTHDVFGGLKLGLPGQIRDAERGPGTTDSETMIRLPGDESARPCRTH